MHGEYITDKELKTRFNSDPDVFLAAYERHAGLDRSKVKRVSRKKLVTRCPFHDDQTPSAAFIERPGGLWVFKCSAASCPASARTRLVFNTLTEHAGVTPDALLDWTASRLGERRTFATRGQVSKLEPSPVELIPEKAEVEAVEADVEPERFDLEYWTERFAQAYFRLDRLDHLSAPEVLRGFTVSEALSLGLGIREICGQDVLMMVKRDLHGRPLGFKTRYTPEAAACIRRILAERGGIEDPKAVARIHWPKYREHPVGVHVPWVRWGTGREVYVVEGELNAMSAAVLLPREVTVIGLPGQDAGILKVSPYRSLLTGASRIHAYFDEDAAGRAFLDVLRELGTYREPFDLSKVRVIPPLGGPDFNDLLRRSRRRLQAVLTPAPRIAPGPLAEVELTPPQEWAPGILRNRPVLFFGPPGSHKTTFTVGYVFAALTGVSPFPGVPINLDGHGFDQVVYVSFEEPGQVLWNLGSIFEGMEPEMRRAWPEWFEGEGEPLGRFFEHAADYLRLVPGRALEGKSPAEVLDVVPLGQDTLLVMDPFGYYLNTIGDENSAETVAQVWDALTERTERVAVSGGSLTTLLVDHVNLANFLNTMKALKEGKNPVSVTPRGNMRKLDKPRSVRMLVNYPAEGWVRPPVDVAGRQVPGVLVREEMVKNSFGGLWTRYWNIGYVELTPGKVALWEGVPLTITRALRVERYDRIEAVRYVPPQFEVDEYGEEPIFVPGWREPELPEEKVITAKVVTEAERAKEALKAELANPPVYLPTLEEEFDRKVLDYAVDVLVRSGLARRSGEYLHPRAALFQEGTREWEVFNFMVSELTRNGTALTVRQLQEEVQARYGIRKSQAYSLVGRILARAQKEGVIEVKELSNERGKPKMVRLMVPEDVLDVYL